VIDGEPKHAAIVVPARKSPSRGLGAAFAIGHLWAMKNILLSAIAAAVVAALASCATVSAQQSDPVEIDETGVDTSPAASAGDETAAGPIADPIVDSGSDNATIADPTDTTDQTTDGPADDTAAAPLDRDAALAAIDAYLDDLDVLTGSFIQLEPNGAVATGEFWLDRPGRIRFEYADPHPFTIVADGASYIVWDRELEDVNTRVPLRETPLNMFLRRDVNLARDAIILDVTETIDELSVELQDPDERVEGSLTLVFARPALDLRRLITTDAAGQSTQIIFTDTARGGRVDPAMFVIRENRRRRGGG